MRERTAWILGGIAAALPIAGLLVWLNLDGDSGSVEIPFLPESPAAPSHPRLQVLDEPEDERLGLAPVAPKDLRPPTTKPEE